MIAVQRMENWQFRGLQTRYGARNNTKSSNNECDNKKDILLREHEAGRRSDENQGRWGEISEHLFRSGITGVDENDNTNW